MYGATSQGQEQPAGERDAFNFYWDTGRKRPEGIDTWTVGRGFFAAAHQEEEEEEIEFIKGRRLEFYIGVCAEGP